MRTMHSFPSATASFLNTRRGFERACFINSNVPEMFLDNLQSVVIPTFAVQVLLFLQIKNGRG